MPNAASLAGTEVPDGHPHPPPRVLIVLPTWFAWTIVVGMGVALVAAGIALVELVALRGDIAHLTNTIQLK